MDEINEYVERLEAENESLFGRLDAATRSNVRLARTLSSIHALLYPAKGNGMVFRSIDPHEVLQELSDRIRAIDKAEVDRVIAEWMMIENAGMSAPQRVSVT